MTTALIGYSGFVGETLMRQSEFDDLYRSTNINEIEHKEYDFVICAGAPAKKWIANKNPDTDRNTINRLVSHLKTIKCKQFVLISTVDVFSDPNLVNEQSIPDKSGLHPYGLNRLMLEEFVQDQFVNHLVVRLPGLVGPGLKKNIIFDFLNNNNLEVIDSRSKFQFYPMVNLWFDIQIALRNQLSLIHLTAEPITSADVGNLCFGLPFENEILEKPPEYNFQSNFSNLYQSNSVYQYSVREVISAIRAYAQSESRTILESKAQ